MGLLSYQMQFYGNIKIHDICSVILIDAPTVVPRMLVSDTLSYRTSFL